MSCVAERSAPTEDLLAGVLARVEVRQHRLERRRLIQA
jgi:hypothetical protein